MHGPREHGTSARGRRKLRELVLLGPAADDVDSRDPLTAHLVDTLYGVAIAHREAFQNAAHDLSF